MRCGDLWGSHIFGCAVFLSDGWQIDDCWAVIGLPVCIFSHVTTKALPGLDCRGCTCESAALCQCDNSRFFFFSQEEETKETGRMRKLPLGGEDTRLLEFFFSPAFPASSVCVCACVCVSLREKASQISYVAAGLCIESYLKQSICVWHL